MTKQELASKIWETSNALRKKIKSSEFKDYIIGFMFYKYLSDKEEAFLLSEDLTIEDLKDCNDDAKDFIKTNVGYFISYENLFSIWRGMKGKLGAAVVSEALIDFNKNINPTYKKVFDNIFSTLQGGLSKLGDNSGSRDEAVRDIIDLIDEIPTTNDTYDVLGYVYEFLIYKFATTAKEDGAYYTPHEVSSLISQIVAEAMKDKEDLTIYDPTSGSGSLLLNIGKEANKYINNDHIKYYGQELITETYHLSRMNLIMKGIKVPNIFIRNGDTLEDDWPYFDEHTSYESLNVNTVVSNPPYSAHWNPEKHDNDPRFKYGLAPSSKADFAFLQHCLYHLQSDGIMAIVLPHGVLFRGGEEGTIRKNLIENNHIETIIGLPSNLFFATGIPTTIIILRKNRVNNDVLFIDASKAFTKDKTQNVLRERDIKKILDVVKNKKNIDSFSRLVTKKEIVENDYNLNIPRYISADAKTDTYDLYSVMTGQISDVEISNFDAFWDRFNALKTKTLISKDGYNTFINVDIDNTIHNDGDILKFKQDFYDLSNEFQNNLIDTLVTNITKTNEYTKDEIIKNLFNLVNKESFIDKYDVYQVFTEKWDEIENDIIVIRENGLSVCKEVEVNMIVKKVAKTKKIYEEQNGWKGRIIPFDLVKDSFFDSDFEKIKSLETDISSCTSECAEIFENLDEEIKKQVQKEDESWFDLKLLKVIVKDNKEDEEVIKTLQTVLDLINKEKEINRKIKKITENLDIKAKEKIESLSDDEVNDLLILKWIEPIITNIKVIADNTIDNFVRELDNLKKKYSNPLKELNKKVHDKDEKLFELMDSLTGPVKDLEALNMLKDALK